MFKKLLSNLAFNPSLIGQVGFYSKRVHAESTVRRSGFIILALAVVLQVFAVVSPAQPTLASSSNDMITGGVTSREQTLSYCYSNTRDYKTILEYYGINCTDLANAPVVTVKSTDHSKKLYSMGHLAYGKSGETAVTIPNVSGTMYLRYLWSWDNGAASTYKAFKGTTSSGTTFYILFSCGNLTFVGMPKPVKPKTDTPTPPTTPPTDICSNVPGTQTKQEECDVCSNVSGTQTDASQCDVCANVSGAQTSVTECDVCPGTTGTQTSTSQCDVCPDVSGTQTKSSQCDVCPKIPGVQSKTTECDVCPNISGTQSSTADCDACPQTVGIQNSKSECDVCPGVSGEQTTLDQCDVCPEVAGTQSSKNDCDVCPQISGVQTDASQCKSCSSSQNQSDVIACLTYGKSVRNTTQNKPNADGTTANPGDILVYTLTTKNTGSITVKDYYVNENVSDVLDYADITNYKDSTKNADNIITWPATTIEPGKSVIREFEVKIKSTLPATPASASDPGHYDMKMTNVYGNSVSVKLPPPTPAKALEVATVTTLPNTGPGTSVAIAFVITVFAGYFFARSRLMAKELDIVRADFASSGGM